MQDELRYFGSVTFAKQFASTFVTRNLGAFDVYIYGMCCSPVKSIDTVTPNKGESLDCCCSHCSSN